MADVKKSLSYIWAKESDLSETYEFQFSGKDWSCIRKNGSDERRFRLSYDESERRLWWGGSYFMDPVDLTKKADRALWYRATDTTKRKAAFTWHRREQRPLAPEAPSRPAAKAKAVIASKAPAAAKAPAPATPTIRVLTRPTAGEKGANDASVPAREQESGNLPQGPMSVVDVKKSLSYIWAKESDVKETYEFQITTKDWSCIRKNQGSERKFRLHYDAEARIIWWGESYFLDPEDLRKKPERAMWYRSSDTARKKAAFIWQRREPKQLPPEALAQSTRQRGMPSSRSAASISVTAVGDGVERQIRNRGAPNSRTLPEVILDLEQAFVIYKPPHWRCELPSKDATVPDEQSGRGSRDPLILLRWMREELTSINPELFEEDFNPALSGTGFGPLSHRIDQETSGPMIVAKTKEAQRFLKAQFHKTEVSKRYVCLVHGRVAKPGGTIDANIRTFRTDSLTLSEISTSGDWAQTDYQVIATFGPINSRGTRGGFSLVACDIKSGRTHQIRIHMLHLGHALVAEDKYVSQEQLLEDRTWCPRLFLHSYRLRFRGIDNGHIQVTCPLPDDLKAALQRLGAAEPTGHSADMLFGETSWMSEVFRPPILAWRPNTRLERCVAALLSGSSDPVALDDINNDEEVQRLAMKEGLKAKDGVSSIGKAWLSKHWRVFEVVPPESGSPNLGNDSGLRLRLRPTYTEGDRDVADPGLDLERKVEAVRFELEELQRLKQRAVAEEQYEKAAEIKKRCESSSAELSSLLQLVDDDVTDQADQATRATRAALHVNAEDGNWIEQPSKFEEDVRDEALFPSLVPSQVPKALVPKRQGSLSVGPAARLSKPAVASASIRSISQGAVATAPAADMDKEKEQVLDFKDALVSFLEGKEGARAHMNEVNNDKFLRQVMAAQRPKPMTAVNKAWLKQNSDVFALLRTKDEEIYVALAKVIEAKTQKAAKGGAAGVQQATDGPKGPAYHQVIQRTAAGDKAPPLVYDYKSASQPKQADEVSSVAMSWQDKFSMTLEKLPQRFCTAEELLKSIPLFADAFGARKALEQKELLVMFLEGFPDKFRVERRGSGAERQFIIWAR